MEKKTQAIKEMGVEKVSSIAEYGVAVDEIIALGKKNAGQSDRHVHAWPIRRQTLGLRQRNRTVVRHSCDAVLVITCDGLNHSAASSE